MHKGGFNVQLQSAADHTQGKLVFNVKEVECVYIVKLTNTFTLIFYATHDTFAHILSVWLSANDVARCYKISGPQEVLKTNQTCSSSPNETI